MLAFCGTPEVELDDQQDIFLRCLTLEQLTSLDVDSRCVVKEMISLPLKL